MRERWHLCPRHCRRDAATYCVQEERAKEKPMRGVSAQLQPAKERRIGEQGKDWTPPVKGEDSSIRRPAGESTS